MRFNPGLEIGQIIDNQGLVDIFRCGNMGGMRRSHTTGTLVLITDYTKGLYHDKWIGGTLHYTGMGKTGDQSLHWAQNATLANYGHNDVDCHLFEVMNAGEYIYCGRVELVGQPYTEIQLDEEGYKRRVWMFPIRPVPENDVVKPALYVFKDMEDYKARGHSVDQEYDIWLKAQKPQKTQKTQKPQKSAKAAGKSDTIIGKTVIHKTYGAGVIKKFDGTIITVKFPNQELKTLNYKISLEKETIRFE